MTIKKTQPCFQNSSTQRAFPPISQMILWGGLRHIQQERFDVVLLNVNMAVIRGIGVIELLASDEILKDQNIFIFSGEDIPDIKVKNLLRRDGVNGFLKKSINLNELLTVITS